MPTLVVTGAWSDLYDEAAGGLVRAGAARAVLARHQLRPQDHDRAWSVVRDHWEHVTA